MSSFLALRGVTQSLANYLASATGVPVEADRPPSDPIPDTNSLIHLYLYRVELNPSFMNLTPVASGNTILRDAPIGINLFYLITPYGNGQLELQMTLGDVIRAFHERAVIPAAFLDASIADSVEELRVVPHALTLEQMTELSRCFGQRPYRLSMTYEASVAVIDSRVERSVVRVEERVVDVGQLR